jgi:hypothetical protein
MKKSFILYNDYKEHISLLSQSEKGDLLDCIFNFTNGEEVSPSGIVAMAFSFIKSQLERDNISYEAKRERNRKNGLKGGRPSKSERLNEEPKETENNRTVFLETEKSLNDTDTDTDTDIIKKQTKFKKPTVDEVKSYCLERNNSVDPQRFMDFYASNGWKVGKNPMKDWKASVRNWEKNNNQSSYLKQQNSYGKKYDNEFRDENGIPY